MRSDPNRIDKRSTRRIQLKRRSAFASLVGHSMFEEGSAFTELVAVIAVSAMAFILILALYGWS